MKDIAIIMIMFALVIFALPFAANALTPHDEPDEPPAAVAQAQEFPEKLKLYLTGSGETVELTASEYLTGCLAAQIPIDYEPEALKAQAAATATYTLRLMRELEAAGKIPDGADITDENDPYYNEEQRKAAYGADYEKYRQNLEVAAEYGRTHIITYGGEPIYAVYHPVSAGATCPSEYIWGRELDYLKSVESPQDATYLNFECTNEMTEPEARAALSRYDPSLEVPVDGAKWFTDLNVNEYGYVISCNIGKNTFSGIDIRTIFGLRSPAFTVTYNSGIFTFTTKGHGHCAGLSQYGANELAKRGETAESIIKTYYRGVSVA